MSIRNFFKNFTDPNLLNGSVFIILGFILHNLVTSRVKSNINSTFKLKVREVLFCKKKP